jgi:hypothetical protein
VRRRATTTARRAGHYGGSEAIVGRGVADRGTPRRKLDQRIRSGDGRAGQKPAVSLGAGRARRYHWKYRREYRKESVIMEDIPLTITVEPGSELARALADANGRPIELVNGDVRYRVSQKEDDVWAGYDPERIRAALERFAGSLSAEEGERIKQLIYRGREEGTRRMDEP